MKSINVKNGHFAKITDKGTSSYTFDEVEQIPGLMKVNQVPTVSEGELYGDGIITEKAALISGYELAIDLNKLPRDIAQYISGKTYSNGVETDDGSCNPKAFAIGWEVEYMEKGAVYSELVWFIDCLAKPIEKNSEQREKDIKFGTQSINVTAFKAPTYNNRAYVLIDTADENVTDDMVADFFSMVQTTTTITAPTVEEPTV